MNKVKLTYSSSIAAALSIVVITAVTIWGELSPSFKTWLAGFTGHHWLTKSALSLIVYFGGLAIFYLLPKGANPNTIRGGLIFLIITALAGFSVVFLFFIWHYLWS
ncbi:MAG: hypothetical protein HYT61_03475 [Candidatus Yanofskybacteria bacterium]|nr:hypothetical protein [Candidatus Yanofskybacteria bacterium]